MRIQNKNTKIQKYKIYGTDKACVVTHNNVAYVIGANGAASNKLLKYFPEKNTFYVSNMYLTNNVSFTQIRANCFVSSRTQSIYIIGGHNDSLADLGGVIRYKSVADFGNSNVPWQTQLPNVWFTLPIVFVTPLYKYCRI